MNGSASRGKKSTHTAKSGAKRLMTTTALAAAGVMSLSGTAHAVGVNEVPTGGTVVGGSATISQPGVGQEIINQSSNRTVINWNSFNIGEAATTTFYQPSAHALAVNRVIGNDPNPAQILGELKANGQLMILDQNGVLFGAHSRIDVNGIVASTGDVDTASVMNGDTTLTLKNFGNGTIDNEGTINVGQAGLAAFVAPTVINNGVINAKMGRVALASGGNSATVDLYGDGLVELAPGGRTGKILNSGTINAEGGTVAMTAMAAKDAVDDVINTSGIVRVSSVTQKGGTIILNGGDGNVSVSGTLDASGATGGGKISIKGKKVAIASSARLNADAILNGNGGNVSTIATGEADIYGVLSAKGGINGGNGGFIETSGNLLDTTNATIDASAANGAAGSWLLDPTNITISTGASSTSFGQSTISATQIDNTLDQGTSVTLSTTGDINDNPVAAGNILINASIDKTAGGDAVLTLNASNNITQKSGTSIGSTSGALGVAMTAGGNTALNGGIQTNGGAITISGSNKVTLGSGTVLDAQGGNLSISQTGIFTSTDDNSLRTSGTGTISLQQNKGGSIQNALNTIDNTGTGLNKVMVGAGTYNENVSLATSNTTLEGAQAGVTATDANRGNGGETIINPASGTGISVTGNGDTVDGFKVSGTDVGIEANGASGVTIQNNIVTDTSSNGIYVVGATGATITGNKVTDTGPTGHGIAFEQGSDNGTASGNTVDHTGYNGIYSSGSTGMLFTGNTVTDAAYYTTTIDPTVVAHGISIENGSGTISDNTVTGGADGILLYDTTAPSFVTGNIVTGSSTYGIKAVDSDGATISGNTVKNATIDGIHVEGGNGVTIGGAGEADGNTVTNSGIDGISVASTTGSVTIQGNMVDKTAAGIQDNGIHINGTIGAVITDNIVKNAGWDGINIQDSEGATVTGNTVTNTQGASAIAAYNGVSDTDIENNTLSNSVAHGVYVSGNTGTLTIQGNDVSNIAFGPGIYVENSDGSASTIEPDAEDSGAGAGKIFFSNLISGNTVHDIGGTGIELVNSSNTQITLNKVNTTTGDGIAIDSSANASIDNNKIGQSGAGSIGGNGISVIDSDTADLNANSIANTAGDGISVDPSANATISDNTITAATLDGIDVLDSSGASLTGNSITNVGGTGITLDGSDSATVSGNLIASTGGDGIYSTASTDGEILDNTIGFTTLKATTSAGANNINGDGIFVTGGNGVTVDGNIITATTSTAYNVGSGIQIVDTNGATVGGTGKGEANIISNTAWDGIRFEGDSNVKALGNKIDTVTRVGIYAGTVSGATISSNTIQNDPLAGFGEIEIDGGSDFKVADNTLSAGSGEGIGINNVAGTNLISGNAIDGMAADGISASSVAGLTIRDNLVGQNGGMIGGDGIAVSDSDYALVKDNTLSLVSQDGIDISSGTGVIVAGNTVEVGYTFDGTASGSAVNGIYANGSDNLTITGNTIDSASADGISIVGGNGVTIGGDKKADGNTVDNSGIDGILVDGTAGTVIIQYNTVDGTSYGTQHNGISIIGTSGATIADNTVSNTGWDGINVQNSDGATIVRNSVTDTLGGSGIAAYTNVSGTDIENNTIGGAYQHGIYISGSEDSLTIAKNTISDVQHGPGIYVENSDAATILKNSTYNTNGDGIEVLGTTTSAIDGNTVILANGNGIDVENAQSTSIDGNLVLATTAYSNGDDIEGEGIHVENVGTDGFGDADYAVSITNNKVGLTANNGIGVYDAGDTLISGNQVALAGINVDNVTSGSNEFTFELALIGDGIIGMPSFTDVPWNAADGIHVENVHHVGSDNIEPVGDGIIFQAALEKVTDSNASGLTVSDNEVRWTDNDGISIANSDAPQVTDNKVHDAGIGEWTFDQDLGNDLSLLPDAAGSLSTVGGNLIAFINDNLPTPATVTHAKGDGIHIINSNHASITGNTIGDAHTDGIEIGSSNHASVLDNTIDHSGYDGIAVHGGHGVTIGEDGDGNTVDHSGHDGIFVENTMDVSKIDGNSVDFTGANGVEVLDADDSRIGDNLIGTAAAEKDNGDANIGNDGILVASDPELITDPTLIHGNTVENTGNNGIETSDVDSVTIRDNTVNNVGNDGIHVVGGDSLLVHNNAVSNAGADGIYAAGIYGDTEDGAILATISGNTITSVGENGIEVDNVDSSLIRNNTIGMSNQIEALEEGDGFVNVSGIGNDGILVSNELYGDPTIIRGNTIRNVNNNGIETNGVDSVTIDGGNSVHGSGNDGIHVEDADTATIHDNDVANSGNDGIYADDTGTLRIARNFVMESTNAGIEVSDANQANLVSNIIIGGAYGIYASGPDDASVILVGNNVINANIGARFESGAIDLTGASNSFTGGSIGLQFSPYQITVEPIEEFALAIRSERDDEDATVTSAPLSLVGDTIGTTQFTGQSTYYVDLENGALFNPGTPTIIDGSNANFDGFTPSLSNNVLTANEYDHLEAMIHDYNDDPTLGLFFVGGVQNADGTDNGLPDLDQENIYDRFGNFLPPGGPLSLTVTGLPHTSFQTASLANIAPAAGDGGNTQPQDIEPAAGGDNHKGNACWGSAFGSGSGSFSVTYGNNANLAQTLSDVSGCGKGF
jgi:filamentous hemagglutinin family protein